MGGKAESRRPLPSLLFSILLAILLHSAAVVHSVTNPSDVEALEVLYGFLNTASQLSGWKSSGGDPCGESWKGVSCTGSSVTSIRVPGLGLNGSLRYLLSDLVALKTLDLSNNMIYGTIPYQLPPNLTYLNLASNDLSGNFPYSVSTMVSLSYLNVSHNFLSESIGDVFTKLHDLSELDLSFNNLTGDLPSSVGSLSNLSSLYLQHNQLTGSVNLLANLDLSNLNIANNNFSGWIPKEFSSIPNLMIEGNSFANGPAPPPPPYTSPPPSRSHNIHNHSQPPPITLQGSVDQASHPVNSKKKNLRADQLIGVVVGSIIAASCATIAAVFCIWKFSKGKDESLNNAKGSLGSPSTDTYKGEWHRFSDYISSHAPTEWSCRINEPISNGQSSSSHQLEAIKEMKEHKARSASFMTYLKPPPVDKVASGKLNRRVESVQKEKAAITATSYSLASLQTATNFFSQECLVGEGTLGRVYRAQLSNGKILAVNKIDSAALCLQQEDNFLEAVSSMSRLRHPNITSLVGYCAENKQHLLVHEFIRNGTLYDMLHFANNSSKMLTWNARVRVALAAARALEYLHEVCLPSVVHRNFKSANILLDEELNPHLSDCGLAALIPNTERQVSTQMASSFGYSAPEFAMSGVCTVKSDVYSFGVVMLELLTGQKSLDSSRVRSERSLVRWATPQLHDIDALAKMVDPALKGIYPAKSLSRFADIIALCVQPEPEFRPPISEVVQALVRLMQRAGIIKKSSEDEFSFSYKIPEHEL